MTRKYLIAFVISVVLVGFLSNVYAIGNVVPKNRTSNSIKPLPEKQIRALLKRHHAQGKFPGASLALQRPGEEILGLTAGSVDPSEGEPTLDPNKPLGIGSTTKTFVAVVVLQLVQSGELDLDQSVKQWFPDLPGASRITPRQLLQHTSGLNEYLETKLVLDDAKRYWPPEELVKVAVDIGKLCEPGEAYNYSNTNYILLGQLIEKITGKPWYAEVRERISDLLRLKHTYYLGEASMSSIGPGYRKIDGQFVDKSEIWHSSLGSSAGGMVSTAHDLLLFIRALMDGRLLDQKRMDEMTKFIPGENYDHIESSYGLGIQRYQVNDLFFYGHFGISSAWSSFIGFEPDSGLAIAVVLNCECVGNAPILGTEVIGLATGEDIAPK